MHDAYMRASGEATWRLVLLAARRLDAMRGEFRLQDLVAEVQRMDPARGRGTIQPVVQGMTANAGSGPASPCGKPLMRTGHGIYTLAVGPRPQSAGTDGPEHATDARRPPRGVAGRTAQVADRLAGVTLDFAACVEAYDRQVPFQRSGQYEWHRMAIEARLRCSSVREALDDEAFPGCYTGRCNGGASGGARPCWYPWPNSGSGCAIRPRPSRRWQDAAIDDHALDIPAVCDQVWQVIENLGIVHNRSVIVPGTKALHHILPDLVPPMDRAWTGAFFLWSAAAPQTAQAAVFTRTFTGLAQVARAVRPAGYIGRGWRTSRSKVLDNAIIGYCKLNEITPVRT